MFSATNKNYSRICAGLAAQCCIILIFFYSHSHQHPHDVDGFVFSKNAFSWFHLMTILLLMGLAFFSLGNIHRYILGYKKKVDSFRSRRLVISCAYISQNIINWIVNSGGWSTSIYNFGIAQQFYCFLHPFFLLWDDDDALTYTHAFSPKQKIFIFLKRI